MFLPCTADSLLRNNQMIYFFISADVIQYQITPPPPPHTKNAENYLSCPFGMNKLHRIIFVSQMCMRDFTLEIQEIFKKIH